MFNKKISLFGNKILKKYKDKVLNDLSYKERMEVLKMMDDSLKNDTINVFIRESNGSVSSRRMNLTNYLSYLQETQGDMTVEELMNYLEEEKSV